MFGGTNTDPAEAPSSGCPVCVRAVIWMPPSTVLLVPIGGTRFSPSDILHVGDGVEVVRAHTVSDAAQVIEGEPIRERPESLFVTPSVRNNTFGIGGPECAIACGVNPTRPQPARVCLGDFRPEPRASIWSRLSSFGVSGTELALRMHVAPSAPQRWLHAISDRALFLHSAIVSRIA